MVLQEMVKLCDKVLGKTTGITSDTFPSYLKVCKTLLNLTHCPSCQPLLRDQSGLDSPLVERIGQLYGKIYSLQLH